MQARLFTRRALPSHHVAVALSYTIKAGRPAARCCYYIESSTIAAHTHNEHRDCLRSELKERVKNIIINASLRMKITAAISVALLSRGVLS